MDAPLDKPTRHRQERPWKATTGASPRVEGCRAAARLRDDVNACGQPFWLKGRFLIGAPILAAFLVPAAVVLILALLEYRSAEATTAPASRGEERPWTERIKRQLQRQSDAATPRVADADFLADVAQVFEEGSASALLAVEDPAQERAFLRMQERALEAGGLDGLTFLPLGAHAGAKLYRVFSARREPLGLLRLRCTGDHWVVVGAEVEKPVSAGRSRKGASPPVPSPGTSRIPRG